jgi:hypothetical protein
MKIVENVKWKVVLLISIYILLVGLSLNRHSHSKLYNYHSELWADRAGYYVYLPAVFIYHLDGSKMDSHIINKTGKGFDIIGNKIITKYTYGTALLESPFFFLAHSITLISEEPVDGFSYYYQKFINVACVTYAFIACLLLYHYIRNYVNSLTAILSILIIFLGTNLFYYTIFETGMSHVYSFFLFSCFIVLSPKLFLERTPVILYILMGLVAGLILATRQINFIFFPVFFLLTKASFKEILKNKLGMTIMIVFAIIVLLPQFLYWHYLSGNFLHYSYGQESFSNWKSPKIIELWFSTNNGLLIFNPLVFFLLGAFMFVARFSVLLKCVIGILIVGISYLFSSWHAWDYGCSYGCRPYVEFYSVLLIPFALFLNQNWQKSKPFFILITIFSVLILYNLKLIFTYDGCMPSAPWDWDAFLSLIINPTK